METPWPAESGLASRPGTDDDDANVRGDAPAGSPVRTIHPELEERAVGRAVSPEVPELESGDLHCGQFGSNGGSGATRQA